MPGLRTRTQRLALKGGMVLFFCLFASLAFVTTPTLGTISPASSTTPPEVAKSFATTYSDTDGWANLKEAYLLISTSSTALTNSDCCGQLLCQEDCRLFEKA